MYVCVCINIYIYIYIYTYIYMYTNMYTYMYMRIHSTATYNESLIPGPQDLVENRRPEVQP